jgi:hypothetical protein
MFINCVSVFRELSDSLLSEGDIFDCNAANSIIEGMDRALNSILTLQLAALELELRNLVDEVGRTKLLQDIEQTNAVFEKLRWHSGRFHNFFLLPHIYERLDDLTIVRKETLYGIEHTIYELQNLSNGLTGRLRFILEEGIGNNADLNGRRRR